MEDDQWAIVFNSTHQVLRAEKVLKENKIKTEVIPLPGQFTNKGVDCGIALQINDSLKHLAEEVLAAYKVDYKGIYSLSKHRP